MKTNYLPSELLWRAAQLTSQKGMKVPRINTEPAPQEMLGLAIGILRRRKHISRFYLAQKIGCTAEELLAFEIGLLPVSEFAKYLPLILRVMGMPEKPLHSYLNKIKYA